MDNYPTRRRFLKTSAVLGASALLGPGLGLSGPDAAQASPAPDLAVVTGGDAFANTVKAVELLGGMSRFVKRQAKVGLLVNNAFRNPGTYTSPDVALAAAWMCFEAGAAEVIDIRTAPARYWPQGKRAGELKEIIERIKPAGGHVEVEIQGSAALKKARLVQDLFEIDVFINAAIAKDHEGTRYSGVLKNMMGAAPHTTCRLFHLGPKGHSWYGDLEHMARCIADINLPRKPDLAILDATEVITTNGPFGPGKTIKPGKVIAGTDPVLTDVYGVSVLGRPAGEIIMLEECAGRGLGRTDLEAARVEEAAA